MGRTNKPTGLKTIEGNRGKRALNPAEPTPDYLVDLTPPAHLSSAAAEIWSELAPKLRACRVLTEADVHMLELGCNAIAEYRRASREISETPLLKSDDGGSGISPWKIVQSMAFKQAIQVLREFGASPAARSRVVADPQGDMFPADRLGQFMRCGAGTH